ncbi:MAG TPA: HIT family protein [Xanthobacteraceae bacterium]|nr:HIT family protein [Xanthobacteraceae bacterium]
MEDQSRAVQADDFEPPAHLVILRTDHWVINHRVDSALPGYLMLGARARTNNLAALPREALHQLGPLLANAQSALTEILKPQHLYVGRYGHSAGFALHFHLIPICAWVKQRFFADPRYRVLQDLADPGSTGDPDGTDGAELTLYVWRAFCESPNPPPISGPSIPEVIERLRALVSA